MGRGRGGYTFLKFQLKKLAFVFANKYGYYTHYLCFVNIIHAKHIIMKLSSIIKHELFKELIFTESSPPVMLKTEIYRAKTGVNIGKISIVLFSALDRFVIPIFY